MLLRLCSVLSLLMRPAFCPRVSLLAFPPEPERAVVSQALKRLHEIFNIGDKPQNYLPHKKPPQFMVDLFNEVADHNGVTRNPRILEGNVVRSFEDRGAFYKIRTRLKNFIRPLQITCHTFLKVIFLFAVYFDRKFHFFNLSSFSKRERMIKAEFRMFRCKRNFFTGKSYSAHFYKVSRHLFESLTSLNSSALFVFFSICCLIDSLIRSTFMKCQKTGCHLGRET